MKYLDKFVQYIRETKELDFDLVENEYLVPIRHLGVKTATYKTLQTKGDFAGYNQISIKFDFGSFNRVDGDGNFIDKRIWELLDELLMFKNVIDTYGGNKVAIWFGTGQINIAIYVKVEEDNKYIINKLYNEINTPYIRKVHFIKNDKENNIMGYIEGTKRTWNNFIRDNEIDLSKFNLEFINVDDDNNQTYWNAKLLVKITIKE